MTVRLIAQAHTGRQKNAHLVNESRREANVDHRRRTKQFDLVSGSPMHGRLYKNVSDIRNGLGIALSQQRHQSKG
jgi:hypothetical protein